VLVIDGEEAIRAYLSALTQDHAETIEAASGDKSISVTKSRVPNLILLDLMSAETDGYQVCKALKQNTTTKHIPVIFITAKTDHAFEAAALKLGAIYYIVKPFNTNIVASKLKIILRSSNGARSLTPLFGDAGIRAT
jgi:putative two-component system response regulator